MARYLYELEAKINSMRQESFFKSFLTVGSATVINLVIGFLTTPIITRIVEPIEYGQFSIFTMYTNLAIMVLCFGMDQSLVRFFYKEDGIRYKKRIFLESIIIPTIVTTLLLLFALSLIKTRILRVEFDWKCSILLAINIFLSLYFRFSSLLVRLNHNNKLYGIIQVLHKALYVVLALLFLKSLNLNGMFSLSLSTVISVAICLLISIISQRSFYSGISEGINLDELKTLFLFGFPYIFSMGITSVFQSLDKLSLNYYRTYSEVGIYASAMTFVSLFGVLQTSFNTIWAPRSVEHYEKSPEEKDYYRIAFNVMTVIMFTLGIALILFKDVFALLLGEKYREASYIMPFLIFHPIMYTISETTVGGINFAKKSSLHIWIAAGSCLVNFIGNTLLVPILGCKGAAISTGISYIVFFVLRTLIAEKYYPVGFDIIRFGIVTLVTIGFAFYNTFVKFNLLSIVFAVVCYAVLALCFKETIKWVIEYAKIRIFPKILPIIKKRK